MDINTQIHNNVCPKAKVFSISPLVLAAWRRKNVANFGCCLINVSYAFVWMCLKFLHHFSIGFLSLLVFIVLKNYLIVRKVRKHVDLTFCHLNSI